jgi:hypothetical protein
MALGGLIMALLRCENLPNKWYKYSSYAYDNAFYRSPLMCNYRCPDRFMPVTIAVFNMCQRLESIVPDYCPHQNLFRIYKGETLTTPHNFARYEIKAKTAKMRDPARRSYLQDVQELRTDYNLDCEACFSNDRSYNDKNKLQKKGYDYSHIPYIMCKFASQVPPKDDKERYKHVCDVCSDMYGSNISINPAGKDHIVNQVGDGANGNSPDGKKEEVPDGEAIKKGMTMVAIMLIFMVFIMYIAYGIDRSASRA